MDLKGSAVQGGGKTILAPLIGGGAPSVSGGKDRGTHRAGGGAGGPGGSGGGGTVGAGRGGGGVGGRGGGLLEEVIGGSRMATGRGQETQSTSECIHTAVVVVCAGHPNTASEKRTATNNGKRIEILGN